MDPIAEWSTAWARVGDLVASLDEEQRAARVPACPDWTVHDLLAHMVGLGADVLDGDEPDDHNAAWTQAQVDARRDRDAAAILAEWASVGERLPGRMQEHGSRPLNDVVIHEQDLRGAVGVPGARQGDGLTIVRDRLAGRLAGALADRPDLPPLALEEVPQPGRKPWTWLSSGDAGDAGDAGVVLRASGFDLFRAVTSRRTPEQLRSYAVRGDVSAYLDALALLGPLPTTPLPE